MMIFMIVVTLLCALNIGVMGYVVYLFAKEVFSESRISTSQFGYLLTVDSSIFALTLSCGICQKMGTIITPH